MPSNVTFFSVDVETSGLTPAHGRLLTVGVVPVRWESVEGGRRRFEMLDESFYIRIDRAAELALDRWESDPRSSYGFWSRQDASVAGEAYADASLPRVTATTAAIMLQDWACSIEPYQEQRVFVANPVAFDKMWVDLLFDEAEVDSPFHWRSLCLRSMKFGLTPGSDWGDSRDGNEPSVPHHALHDARAQAFDLVDMLVQRGRTA